MIDVGNKGALYIIGALLLGVAIVGIGVFYESNWCIPFLILPLFLFLKGASSTGKRENQQIDAMIKSGKSDDEIAKYLNAGPTVAISKNTSWNLLFNIFPENPLKTIKKRRDYLSKSANLEQESTNTNNPVNQTPPPTPPTV